MPLIRQRRILERAALELFLVRGQGRQLIFDQAALLGALERGAQAEGFMSPVKVADHLLHDLPLKPGILRGDSEQGYFFLHLTIQEFLAASALARLVNETETGWKTVVPVDPKKRNVCDFLDEKAWHAEWNEVLAFVCGQVEDARPLVERLADEKEDSFL